MDQRTRPMLSATSAPRPRTGGLVISCGVLVATPKIDELLDQEPGAALTVKVVGLDVWSQQPTMKRDRSPRLVTSFSVLPELNRFVGFFVWQLGVLVFDTPLHCLALREKGDQHRSKDQEKGKT